MTTRIVRMGCATVAGAVALALLWSLLKAAAELFAVLIGRRRPEAWFSDLIVWYADFFAFGLSIA